MCVCVGGGLSATLCGGDLFLMQSSVGSTYAPCACGPPARGDGEGEKERDRR